MGVGGSVIHRAQLLTTVCLSSGALNICWISLFSSDELMCRILGVRSGFSGPGGGQEGHLSTQHHPLPMAGHVSESTLHPHCVDVGGKAWSGTDLSQGHMAG